MCSANWCQPCQKIKPYFLSCNDKYSDISFVYIDVDLNNDIVEQHSIEALPTFLFFDEENKVVERLVGSKQEKLDEYIETFTRN